MHDLSKIKSTVAHDPLPFLTALYGENLRRSGHQWRVGSKGGRCFDITKGELLCATFNGDAGAGDCIEVWKAHHSSDFQSAVRDIAALYGISTGGSEMARPSSTPAPTRPPVPALPKTARPAPWPLLKGDGDRLHAAAFSNLAADISSQRRVAEWRGWPVEQVRRLALGSLIGFCEFDLWPSVIPPQPAAFFRVLHPVEVVDADGAHFWHGHAVQLHVRFLPGATRCDGGALSWIYAPSMKAIGATDGAHAPMVLAHWGHDPEQPGWKRYCDTIIVCAGEWDALTVVIAMDWINDVGILTIPEKLAVVGIRSEGRGGTDAFLRWYQHWNPRSAILLADADATGATWFSPTDNRPCFAEQLEQRGIRVLARTPTRTAQSKDEHAFRSKTSPLGPETPTPKIGFKDVNDLYRAGLLQPHHISDMLTEAGFSMKGAAQ